MPAEGGGGGLERLVLKSSPVKTAAFLVGSVVTVAFGVAMIAGGESPGWLVVALGAAGVLGFSLLLARPNRLELDEGGLTTVTMGRRRSVAWGRCGPFRTAIPDVDGSFTAPARVVFDTEESERSRLALVAHVVAGGTETLPDTYGMSAKDLADLLNRYRTAAAGAADGRGA